MEEAGASLTKDLDEFADTLTDLGRDVNAMVQGATDIAGAVKDLKSATNVGQLGTEDVANDASDAAEDMANDASDAAEDAADSVKDAAKHSIEELQGAVAKAQEEAEQAAKDVQECTEDVESCWNKAVDKMQADAALAKVKAQLWEAKAKKAAEDAVEPMQECTGDVEACAKKAQDDAAQAAQDIEDAAAQTGTDVQVCASDVKDCFEKAKAQADDDFTKTSSDLQKCAASASECFSCLTESDPAACISALPAPGAKLELGDDKADDSDLMAKTSADLEADIAKFKSDAEAAGKELQNCVGDVSECGEKMKAKMTANAKMLQAKANLMEKQMQEDATANSAYFEHCVGDVDAVKECVTNSVEDAKDKAEAAGAKAQECAVDVSGCFEEMRLNIQGDISLGDVEDIIANPPRSSLGCEAEQAAFDAAQSEAQEAAQKVQTSCNGQSDSQECLTSLVEAAKADAAAASAKVALLTEQAKDSTSGVTDDMVAKSQEMAEEIQAKYVRCSENPSWETCKPEDPLLGGSITDDIKECFSDIPECWNKLVGKMKKDAEDAEEKAEEAGDKAKEAAEKAKDDASAATSETAKKAQEEADALKAKADEMAKDAEECAKDPQGCFDKLKKQ